MLLQSISGLSFSTLSFVLIIPNYMTKFGMYIVWEFSKLSSQVGERNTEVLNILKSKSTVGGGGYMESFPPWLSLRPDCLKFQPGQ